MANLDDVRNPLQEGPPSATETRRHIDTALIIAAVSASCYSVGYWVHGREIHQLGIPASLLADVPESDIILNGGLTLLVVMAVSLLIYGVLYIAAMAVPARLSRSVEQVARNFVDRRPKFSLVLCILSLIFLVRTFVYFGPLITTYPLHIGSSYKDCSYKDKSLPRVTLHLKDGQPKVSNNDLLYLSRKDGCFLFKRAGMCQYLVIKENNITLLILSPGDSLGGRTPHPPP